MQLTTWISLFSSISHGFGASLSPFLSKLICLLVIGLNDRFITLKSGFYSIQSGWFCLWYEN